MSSRANRHGSLLRWATLFYGLLAAAALGWNRWAGTSWVFVDEASAAVGVLWARDIALGLATAGAVIGLSYWITTRTGWGDELARELARALGPLSALQCAALAALSGFAEEAFFRGALQPRIGWLAASLVFGLAHFAPRRSLWPWTGFAVLAGLLLGALYAATGNLVAPITAHAAINGVNLRLLTARYREPILR
jgi:membrane protease YdiL (CAAX protease family)